MGSPELWEYNEFHNKEINVSETAEHSHQHTEILQQLKKISEHMGFLEKKIDQLIDSRGNSRPSFGGPNRFGGGNREGFRPPSRESFRPRRPGGPDHGTRTAYYEAGGGRQHSGKPFGNRPPQGGRHDGPPRHGYNKNHAGPRHPR